MQHLTVNSFVLTFSRGFQGLISDVQARIMHKATRRINPTKPNMIVFYPEHRTDLKEHLEDNGRTLITTAKGLTAKVYAKLEDFGSPETLKEWMGEANAPKGNIQHILSFILAEEY